MTRADTLAVLVPVRRRRFHSIRMFVTNAMKLGAATVAAFLMRGKTLGTDKATRLLTKRGQDADLAGLQICTGKRGVQQLTGRRPDGSHIGASIKYGVVKPDPATAS